MSARRYELLTTSCLVVAVVSSFLYGKSPALTSLALVLGVGAAIGALCTYFSNARCLGADRVTDDQKPQADKVSIEVAAPQEAGTSLVASYSVRSLAEGARNVSQISFWDEPFVSAEEQPRVRYYALYHKLQGHKHFANELAVARQRTFRERQVFVDEVVELVERLAPSCELEVNLDGRIMIKPRRSPAKAAEEAPPQVLPSPEPHYKPYN